MKTKIQKIVLRPTKQNIEKQYQYVKKENPYKTRFSLYYDTLFDLYTDLDKLKMEQVQKLLNKKMIKIKIIEVTI